MADVEAPHTRCAGNGGTASQRAGCYAQDRWAVEPAALDVYISDGRVFPSVDNVDETSDAVHEQFLDLFCPGATAPDQLSPVSYGLQKDPGHRILREGAPLFAICLLLSSVSFCAVMFHFKFVLRVPSERELPAGYSSWEDCDQNVTGLSMTAFAHELSYKEARGRISIPKMFVLAAVTTLIAILAAPRDEGPGLIVAIFSFTIASASSVVYALVDLSVRVVPTFVDPLIASQMGLVLTVVLSCTTIRARSSASQVVARYPKLHFLLCVALMFAMNIVILNGLRFLSTRHVHPLLVVSVAILCSRGCAVIGREVFMNVNLPSLACFGLLFVHDASVALCLRRYMLAVGDLRATIAVAWCSVALELAVNSASTIFAVHRYNRLIREQAGAAASVYICYYFTSIVSQLVSEHVALHACLAYSLFLDPRILRINVQFDRSLAIAGWGWSTFAEVVADVVTIGALTIMLPTTFGNLIQKTARSPSLVLLMLCCCLHAHFGGLHVFVDPADYFCEH